MIYKQPTCINYMQKHMQSTTCVTPYAYDKAKQLSYMQNHNKKPNIYTINHMCATSKMKWKMTKQKYYSFSKCE